MSLPPTFVPSFHTDQDLVEKLRYSQLVGSMTVSHLGLGGASFGNIYADLHQDEVNALVTKCLKSGVNYIDTAPWYGQGLSETRLGIALQQVPRQTFYVATKVGRYELDTKNMFDFSEAKTCASVRSSLKKLQLDYIDLIQVHDVEYTTSVDQIVHHTLPTLVALKKEGLVRHIGITGYTLTVLKKIVRLAPPESIDTVLSYGRCNILNQDLLDDLDFFRKRNLGLINASPLALGLLCNEFNVPSWHLAPELTKETCKKAAQFCKDNNVSLASVALRWALRQHDGIATTLTSVTNQKQLAENLSAAADSKQQITDTHLAQEKLVCNLFCDLPITHWENVDVVRYFDEMKANKWRQNVDV